LVVGNPANTNALIAQRNAPELSPRNFTAMTRLDHNRAVAQLSQKMNSSLSNINNMIIWGNHSSTQFPDASNATIGGKPASEVIGDDEWMKSVFIPTVQKRGAAVIAARKLSSAMSAAKAASDHMKDWFQGTTEFVSMGVFSDGSYGTPQDVMFSFPCTVQDGKWSIVQGLPINDLAREKLDITGKELLEEKEEAVKVCL
jgi:malate dehydrogenase